MLRDIKDVLRDLISDLNMGKLMEEARIVRGWRDIVGEHVAENSSPISLVRGTLLIGAYNSAWSNQLSMMRTGLVEEINSHLGREVVKEIRFKLIEKAKEESDEAAPEERTSLFGEGEKKKILGDLLLNVEDAEVRESLKRAIFLDDQK
ncbi:MAG: DUF721 domain-containing protein [Actinomycetota bacterium]|nr:DUF721 domain-containing protein [Actinomycetota bacterium]